MTPEEHKARHVELHKSLDELVADFIQQTPIGEDALRKNIVDLLLWSYQQTVKPTEPKQ